ncbi:beta-glucosidase [Halogranum rubrum]|uniref:beta-glucosidase n=1 Tax=Halogranum rubrum TaxID=553466 RepID=A0A1I4E0C5_9EURY|nr:glycoside hydrolase family 3 N-terminal domain-containing protein [Halogranum rubrum]SFK99278.1 beta-glucosidase [Halogranum rubrum]
MHADDADSRVEALLDEMTLREKAAQLAGTYVGEMAEHPTQTVDEVEALVRNPGIGFATPFGFGGSPHTGSKEVVDIANRLQRAAVEETRLGIPLLIPVDTIHGHAYVQNTTVFPHNLGLAATRNRALLERVGTTTAREVAATGARLSYGPTCDVARDPRWGRTFETFGESPLLCGELAAAKSRGVHDADVDVATMAKHFPAYGEPERGEDTAPVDRSLSSLRRDFVRAFEPILEEGLEGIMPSYNSINGEPSHGSSYWLTDVLREELGFDGYVASDWNGVRMLHEDHRVAESMREAIRQSMTAGVDVHSLGSVDHTDHVVGLVESGEVDESVVDESVRRVLELKADLGLFEDPYVDAEGLDDVLGTDAHRETALDAARQSMTLLQNEDDLLPFDPDTDEVFVTGPNSDALSNQVGGWSVSKDDEVTGISVRDGIESVVGDDTTVTYEQGAGIDEPADVEAAVEAAESADVAVVVLGENWYIHEFGVQEITGPTDRFPKRTQLTLPDAQQDLLEAIVETETPTALVFITGRPLATPWAEANVPAILQAYYPGADGGRAVAETLFGHNNPSGKLPISVPRSTGHLPTRHNHLPNPTPIGREEHEPSYDPLWAFGHGLSYTDFEYRDLSLSAETVDPDGRVTVGVDVANVGDRAGDEAVQLFGAREYSSTVTPVRELVDFERVSLDAGETATVEFDLPASAFSVFHPDGSRVVEAGTVTVECEGSTASLTVADDG